MKHMQWNSSYNTNDNQQLLAAGKMNKYLHISKEADVKHMQMKKLAYKNLNENTQKVLDIN